MGKIQKEWETFRNMVIPDDVGEEQIADLKYAFYGGVLIMFGVFRNLPEVENDDEIANIICSIDDELRTFVEVVVERATGIQESRTAVKH